MAASTEISPSRTSWWRKIGGGALSVALILHMLLMLAGAYWIFRVRQPVEPEGFLPGREGGSKNDGGRSLVKRDHSTSTRRQNMVTEEVRRIAVTHQTSDFILPDMTGAVVPISGLPVFGGESSMSGVFDGRGGPGGSGGDQNGPSIKGPHKGPVFGMIPDTMRKRCSKDDRLQRIRESGGTPGCEDAVARALQWLKANQNADGSWGGPNKVAMTGLALLAYFGHCENPASIEYGESCLKGITFLVDTGMRNDGRLATNLSANHWPYEQAIATYALAEAVTFCRGIRFDVPYLAEITGRAGQLIIDNQHENGGWAYLYAKSGGHTDVSVTGWQIQALKACDHTGIRFKGMNGCIGDGLAYIRARQNDEGGYGYTGREAAGGLAYCSLSGVGMLCQQMWNKGGGADVRKAARYVLENTRFDYNSERCDLYAHYYESQAMMRSGGRNWETYNAMFRDQLLKNQDADGSWKVPGGGHKIEAVAPQWAADTPEGRIYRTTLCTLMLEVYYRFLGTDGGRTSRAMF